MDVVAIGSKCLELNFINFFLRSYNFVSIWCLLKRRCCLFVCSGTPWTEEEHVVFLAGLKKLGKGDWRGISKKFVTTRSPSQVASHAQKYFLRQAAIDKKKRRPSVFDLSLNEYVIHLSPSLPLSLCLSHFIDMTRIMDLQEITPKDSPVSQTKKSDGERSSEVSPYTQVYSNIMQNSMLKYSC